VDETRLLRMILVRLDWTGDPSCLLAVPAVKFETPCFATILAWIRLDPPSLVCLPVKEPAERPFQSPILLVCNAARMSRTA
jgi:hypothetical protein